MTEMVRSPLSAFRLPPTGHAEERREAALYPAAEQRRSTLVFSRSGVTLAVYAVYILTNASRRPFYVGFTGRLLFRTEQHKQNVFRNSYTAHYNLHRLVYFEMFYDPYAAIAREKELKGWSRSKKIALVEKVNPKWDDLSRDWEKAFALQNQGPSSLLAR